MSAKHDVLVVGAGIFGLSAALELKKRGNSVAVLDPGPLPHPLAASTDISKVVRMSYGSDEFYMALCEWARARWLAWNEEFQRPLYHETGIIAVTRTPMAPGGFEYESYQLALKRGHPFERLTSQAIAERFPVWNAESYVDGYFDPQAGYVESSQVIKALLDWVVRAGVSLYPETRVTALEGDGRVTGVRTVDGTRFDAGHVVVAAGAWTPLLVPELAPVMHSVGQPVFHLRPDNPDDFVPPRFSVFMADVSATGWYGFPLHPIEKVVKIAHHGAGLPLHPSDDERVVYDSDEQRLRRFLADTFPSLVDAPIVYTRRCLYCDTLDEHFWIDTHPGRPGLTVASGGSGHAFKFGSVLGDLIADAVEARENPYLERFRWRELGAEVSGEERSRYHGD